MKKPIVVTLGEAAGIGPEVVEQALPRFRKKYPKVIVDVLGDPDIALPGKPTRKSAQSALEALELSAEMARAGEAAAIVNGPVSKKWLQKAGFGYPGQTEFYADAFGLNEDQVTMTMTGKSMTVGLVSTHCSLVSALEKISVSRIVETGLRLEALLRAKGIRKPRLAVAGLNPHAGESGAFGQEEISMITPAVAALQNKLRRCVAGPVSPDAVFMACSNNKYDGVVSMYHDQGLIPFKLVSFDTGVNVTAGLPLWRISPDHGTAFDIAGQGKARASSMFCALELAYQLSQKSK
ncbi:MAG: 4-hydroxythreonine-4-phosphate dehydrogenase PdxA [Verrucomicrobiota bacterium]